MNKEREHFKRNFSAYRSMWIIVTFDLPTLTPAQKKAYTTFRKFLLSDGFSMHQYSVYVRHCASLENTNVHEERIRKNLPDEGSVSIIRITDKQFGNIVNLYGKKEKKLPRESNQLEIFLMMQKAKRKKQRLRNVTNSDLLSIHNNPQRKRMALSNVTNSDLLSIHN